MKKVFTMLSITAASYCSYAQTNIFPSSGNVGIGTTNPTNKLDIAEPSGANTYVTVSNNIIGTLFGAAGNSFGIVGTASNHALAIYTNNSEKMRVTNNGNVGIGTSSPQSKLHIDSDLNGLSAINIGSPGTSGNINVPIGGSPGGYNIDFYTWRDIAQDQIGARIRAERINKYADNYALVQSMDLGFYTSNGIAAESLSEKMRITSDGNVGIGTKDPKGYKLAVAGNMIAESVKVKLLGTWPDYVFSDDYKLPSLHEIEKHIKEKGHLDGIPSAEEVNAKGMDLGEMNVKLLQKIEELTLYLIEQNKEISELKNEVYKSKNR